jgi:acetylglutamate kinase
MFERLIRRARVVIEALPYLREFHGKVVVIKYGGSAMVDPELKKSVLRDIVFLKYVGIHPVIVHGGGLEISKRLKRRKIKTRFVQGLRVTTNEIMRIVEYVLGNRVNREIVRQLKKHGGKAKGFYGKKGEVIKARKHWVRNEKGHYVDLGRTGTVAGIRYRFLRKWIKKGYIPVLSPIGVGSRGKTYNINADNAAAAIAAHLDAEKLILLTDVRGVFNKEGELISEIDADHIKKMIKRRVIKGGMIPKVQCGLYALKHGVEQVHILDGQIPHVLLLELFTERGIGTMVVK